MTGLAYGGAPIDRLTDAQGERLAALLVSVGLSSSQADQIVRRFNESTTPPDRKEPDQ